MNLLQEAAMPTPGKAVNWQSPTGQCTNCGVSTLHFLHQVRHRGIPRRLCTSCMLRLHPTSFCPVCFAFYDGVPPHPSKRISCSKCASFTHIHCAATSPLSPYICTPCNNSSSSFSFFHQTDRIDKKQAVVLLCAARIAASSMSKAAALAKEEAERKVREAACARKRAREALEHLAWVSNVESARRQEEMWNGNNNNNNNGVAIAIAIANANAKDGEEMEEGDFESLVRHLENTLVKEEEVVDVAI